MRTRAAELPDWVGADRKLESFVTIQYLDIPYAKNSVAAKVFVYSFINAIHRVGLSGIDIRGAAKGDEEFPRQNGKCAILDAQDSIRLLKIHNPDGLLPAAELLSVIPAPALRAITTSHLIGRVHYENLTFGEFAEEDDELETLGERYSTFVRWGEPSPALAIATATGKSVEDVHNRLKVARRRSYLPAAGQGIRAAVTD